MPRRRLHRRRQTPVCLKGEFGRPTNWLTCQLSEAAAAAIFNLITLLSTKLWAPNWLLAPISQALILQRTEDNETIDSRTRSKAPQSGKQKNSLRCLICARSAVLISLKLSMLQSVSNILFSLPASSAVEKRPTNHPYYRNAGRASEPLMIMTMMTKMQRIWLPGSNSLFQLG